METVGIIGAGLMGKGLAKNLIKAGYPMTVYKRKASMGDAVAAELRGLGAKITDQVGDLFGSAEILVLCLPNSQIVEDIIIGKGGLTEHPAPRVKTVLDFSTAHPESTKKIAGILRSRGVAMLDTPMSGGPQQADEGKVKLAVGGDKAVFEMYEDLLKKVAEMVFYAGGHGAGNVVKLVNNFMAFLDQTATAGASLLMDKMEISRDAYMGFIGNSGGNSWGFKAMMNRVVTGDFSLKFALGLAFKDLRYCKDLFDGYGGFPVVDALHAVLKGADESGLGEKDIGTVYQYLKEHTAKIKS